MLSLKLTGLIRYPREKVLLMRFIPSIVWELKEEDISLVLGKKIFEY
ncbi:hypothetical protein LCGC14_2526120 [marine sediment metagenome]|uniref:Uncharacterized protein n=1 Tax=marine sediment metagenome TaxID=412755 RepID=A0A0F9D6I1_9ZZZZ